MILRERYIKNPSAGAVSWNTHSDLRGVIEHICINPSQTTTIYDFSISDDAGNVVYDKKGLAGTYVDDSKLGVFGIYTLAVTNASSSNYSFSTTLLWEESP